MKLSSIVLAAGMALGTVGAQAAGGPLDLSTGSTSFGSTPTAGLFADLFTFTLSTPSTLIASFTSVVSGMQDVDFNVVALTGPSGFLSFTQVLPDPVEVYSLSTGTLLAGNYTLVIAGTNSPSIGSYGGSIAVTPIPEPQTYALLLAGLLTVGFIARRRFD